jgi:hypothetical protein
MNREHLATGHDETVDPIALIKMYGQSDVKKTIKLRLRDALTRINAISAPEDEGRAHRRTNIRRKADI